MATFTRADILDWKDGYEGIEKTIENNRYKIKNLYAESQQYNRQIIAIVQRLQKINQDSITINNTKLDNIRKESSAAKNESDNASYRYRLAREEQQLSLLRLQAGELAEQQSALAHEHQQLLLKDNSQDKWNEENAQLSDKVIKAARQQTELDLQIKASEAVIDKLKPLVKDDGKAEFEELEQMRVRSLELEKKFADIEVKAKEIEKQLEKYRADDEVYRKVIGQPDLSKNLIELTRDHKQAGGKSATELSGICSSAKEHLATIRVLENNNRWQEKQLLKLAENEYLRDVVYDSYKLCIKLSTDIKTVVTEYETNYPNEQSAFIRKCLHELQKYNRLFYADLTRENADENYYQYLGMIESIRREASIHAAHDVEKTELLRLLNLHIFAKHLLDGNDVFNEFTALKEHQDRYKPDNDDQVRELEVNEFQQALQATEEACNVRLIANPPESLRKVYEYGLELKREVANEHLSYASRQREHLFDFKYFTKLLSEAREVIRTPHDPDVRAKFEKTLNFNTAGASNKSLRWKAIAFALTGAALAVGGLILGITMFGISTPVSIAMYAAGGAMFMVGAACLYVSRQKGLDKKGHELARHSMFAPEFVPVAAAVDRREPKIIVAI